MQTVWKLFNITPYWISYFDLLLADTTTADYDTLEFIAHILVVTLWFNFNEQL